MSKFATSFKIAKNCLYVSFVALATNSAMAKSNENLGSVASSITDTFTPIAALITGMCYIVGLGMVLMSLLGFKQHKDNPTQHPLTKPVTLFCVGAALVFLPSILNVAGGTLFGSSGGTAGSPTGFSFS